MNDDGVPNESSLTGGNTAPFMGLPQAAGRRIFDLLKAPSQWIHRCFFCLLLPVAVTRRVVDLAAQRSSCLHE